MRTGRLIRRVFLPDQRGARFWQIMGPAFASRTVRRQLPWIVDDGYAWFCLLDGDELVAFGGVSTDGDSGRLHHAWTAIAYRGRGLAKRVTKERLEYLQRSGIHSVSTMATERWARVLVRDFGFTEVSRRGSYRGLKKEIVCIP